MYLAYTVKKKKKNRLILFSDPLFYQTELSPHCFSYYSRHFPLILEIQLYYQNLFIEGFFFPILGKVLQVKHFLRHDIRAVTF